MIKLLNSFRKEESGATMVEYGLMVAVIAMVVVIGAVGLGTEVTNIMDDAESCVSTTGTDCDASS